MSPLLLGLLPGGLQAQALGDGPDAGAQSCLPRPQPDPGDREQDPETPGPSQVVKGTGLN